MSSTADDLSELNLPAPGKAWAVFSETSEHVSLSVGRFTLAAKIHNLSSQSLSLDSQQAFYEEELRRDDTDYLDRQDTGTIGLNVLLQSGAAEATCRRIAEQAGIGFLLQRGYRLLSTGESRLLLLLREVLTQPDILLIEQPFEGLDAQRRVTSEDIFREYLRLGKRLVFWVDRVEDLPQCVEQSLLVGNAMETLQFAASDTPQLQQMLSLWGINSCNQDVALPPPPAELLPLPAPLLRMTDCAVHYLDDQKERVTQFEQLNWELFAGQHTLVLGPNGAGKSTLLQMLSCDHPQSYGNDLLLFGYQRGSGESVWDIKRNIGLVSPALHRDYRAGGNLLSVVVSGLYDSIGVYRDIPEPDRRLAQQWLELIGMAANASTSFNSLTWGQQRLVLIARGLIKYPPLLILDEPTQGLDERDRQLVLAFLPRLAQLQRTTLLMVTHRRDEQLALFERQLRFEPADTPGVRYRIVVSSNCSNADARQ